MSDRLASVGGKETMFEGSWKVKRSTKIYSIALAALLAIGLAGWGIGVLAGKNSTDETPQATVSAGVLPSPSSDPAPSSSATAPAPGLPVAPWDEPKEYDPGTSLPRLREGAAMPYTSSAQTFAASLGEVFSIDYATDSWQGKVDGVKASCLQGEKTYGLSREKLDELCDYSARLVASDSQVFEHKASQGIRFEVKISKIERLSLSEATAGAGEYLKPLCAQGVWGVGAFRVIGSSITYGEEPQPDVHPWQMKIIGAQVSPDPGWTALDSLEGTHAELIALLP